MRVEVIESPPVLIERTIRVTLTQDEVKSLVTDYCHTTLRDTDALGIQLIKRVMLEFT